MCAAFHLCQHGMDAAQQEEWNQQFTGYNASNLLTLNVFRSQHSDCVYVDQGHPAVHLLRLNKEIVGIDVDQIPLIDGHLFKMSRTLFETSCETVINCVLRQGTVREL